ncbi:DUF4214 domain-containing protein [Cellulomonas sp. KRMCY2]|uniref:DUF4214 domain-containing protein n=1 Tax=Cellulomonas sp. KRMCY2 TaxID=1304865 RepID=UPI0004B513AC|nr:DUF4214 domain-containing protein [Cellulomonas sp. KRMCY2]
MSLLGKRSLWGVIAATALVLTPLSASAVEPFPDNGGADTTPFADIAGATADVGVDQTVLITPICQGFTVTNRYTETVDVLFGDFANGIQDAGVLVEPGETVRVNTPRGLIDYVAWAMASDYMAGTGQDVAINQSCTPTPRTQTEQVQKYINQVYRDLFYRVPDTQGLATWTTALLNGAPRVAVANAITYSPEYRSWLISGVYWQFLGRDPDAGGLANWLGAMQGGMTIAQMESGFIASDEYYAAAGGTPEAWVDALYNDVLWRNASDAEIASWVGVLAAGGSRSQVAMGFLLSTEHLTDVVATYYWQLLGRDIDAAGKSSWVTILGAGGRDEAVIGSIIASDEYYNKG